jgi:hypothetical protein
MPEIIIKTNELKFGAAGNGALNVQLKLPHPNQPLTPSDEDLFQLDFDLSAGNSFAIGSPNSVKLSVLAETKSSLTPLWKSSSEARKRILHEFKKENYFAAHDDRMLLLFQLGAKVDGNVAAKIRHSALSASLTLRAGADASYAMLSSAPLDIPAETLVRDFLGSMRLPADISTPLTNDEVIIFEYGGYLDFKAVVGVGYELSGAPSFKLGDLQLSEKYDFSLLTKLNLGAGIAGRFRIIVFAGSKPGWVRVSVLKSASKEFSLAAITDISAEVATKGWPAKANDLLGAMLGLNAKNWLNLFERIRVLTDFNQLEEFLDQLAKRFIEEYTGKAFDLLRDKTQFDEFLSEVHRVTQTYHDLGNHAVTLFDKYFDPVRKQIDERLTAALRKIKEATTWEELKVQINLNLDDVLWDVVNQLTGGDLLGWMLGEIEINGSPADALELLKQRVEKALDLIENNAHEQIRLVIALAKSKFPLDHFIEELNDVTDLAALEAKASKTLTAFVERVIGETLSSLSQSEAGAAIKRFHEALVAISEFRDTIYRKISETLRQSFELNLQSAYNRATEDEALFDFELNLEAEGGKRLMREVGLGDFGGVLAEFNRDFVKLNEGTLLHRLTRESKVTFNIFGWHRNWRYQGFDRVIVNADQRIQADDAGQLIVTTNLDLEKERERKRNGERVYTNLLLRFIGESHDKIEFDASSRMYLIDAITRISARYKLVLDDQETDPEELNKYLAFAVEFGLAASGQEAFDKFKTLLPTDEHGNFGKVSLSYNVRFTEESLRPLFHPGFYEHGKFKQDIEEKLRRTMRLLTLINYQRKGLHLENISWAYWTPAVYKLRQEQGGAFVPDSDREISQIHPSPLAHLKPPEKITLKREHFIVLGTLYNIEDSMIEGMERLATLVSGNGRLKPRDFENALGQFGDALKGFDDLDEGDNTVFAIIDRLTFMAGAKERNSSLTLTVNFNGQEIKHLLVA